MKVKLYQIDAFASKVFSGNPAAVCPLADWPDDSLLQQIAAENNLAETAYYVKAGEEFRIRWFTPVTEVDLCGHATLAAAYVLFNHEGHRGTSIVFQSRSGLLTVTRDQDWYTLNFPVDEIRQIEPPVLISQCFNPKPTGVFRGRSDLLLTYASQKEIENLIPNFSEISRLDARGVVATAPGRDTDFVSRFFAPQSGINEDPVTGSAHTTLTLYWSKILRKTELTARQLSARGGYLKCKLTGSRVEISGQAAFYLAGEISV